MKSFAFAALLLSACLAHAQAEPRAAPPPASQPTCGDALGQARGHLALYQRAKSPPKAEPKKARDAWAAEPASCRAGQWYTMAANLLRNPGAPKEALTVDALSFASARAALEAGLQAVPRDPELLAYLAYLARVAPDLAPALPKDACAALKDAEAAWRDYVCAEQAFVDGRYEEAGKLVAGLGSPRLPDLAELRALAAAKTGTKPAGAAPPAPKLSCDPFCPMELWRQGGLPR